MSFLRTTKIMFYLIFNDHDHEGRGGS